MGKRILIAAGDVEVTAELNSTATAEAIWEALPIKGRAILWGDEIYFSIPLSLQLEAGQEVVSMGDATTLKKVANGTAITVRNCE